MWRLRFRNRTSETSETLEDGGQATANDLKELNLGTTDKPLGVQGHVCMELQGNAKAWSQSRSPSIIPQGECPAQKATLMTFLPEVSIWNWKRGLQTHSGWIHSWGKISDLDRKHCPCKEEEQATSYLHGLPGSQQHLPRRWFPVVDHQAHDRFNHRTPSLIFYRLYCKVQSNPNGTRRLRNHNISHNQRNLML